MAHNRNQPYPEPTTLGVVNLLAVPLTNKAKIDVVLPHALPFIDGQFILQTQLNGVTLFLR